MIKCRKLKKIVINFFDLKIRGHFPSFYFQDLFPDLLQHKSKMEREGGREVKREGDRRFRCSFMELSELYDLILAYNSLYIFGHLTRCQCGQVKKPPTLEIINK